ncbi:hypothetical protein EUTSA_v10015562mg [Eutrema salsugineum]|uniref:Neprosin PEP catalytic domain-containing protein n=1 Tax=Eutrema salsugineum TaxID=72664 RepID=V4LFF1_EUTSA|nr:hypothetical protein EUTSA_v10015562mg [Eutrema salsugineum]
MEPSFSISKPKNKARDESKSKTNIECPNGTVPILRNTKEYVANAQYWAGKHFNPLTAESHGTHGANGAGCYNTICPGFVQVSKTDMLSMPYPYPRKGELGVYASVQQDKETGNWWTTDVRYFKKDVGIGYWPKELFDLIDKSVDMVGVTGAVQSSPFGISPPMGNGHLPTKNEDESARVKSVKIIDSNFKIKGSDKYKLEKILDNDKCYGLRDGKTKYFFKVSNLFTYGGPGGNSCGI